MTAHSRPDAGAPGQSTRDDSGRLLSVLDSVQKEIDALKAAGQEAERRSAELGTREARISAKEAELQERFDALESDRAALESARAEFDQRQHQLGEREQRAQSAEQSAQKIQAETESLRARLAESAENLKHRESELAQRESALNDASGKLQQELERLKAETEEAIEARARLEEAAKERAAEHEQSLLRLRTELDAHKKRESGASAKIAELQKQLEQARTASSAGDAKSTESIARLEKELAERNSERAKLAEALDAANAQVESLRADQAAGGAETSEKVARLQSELSQLAGERQELSSSLDAAKSQIDSLRAEVEKARAQARSFEGIDLAVTPFNATRRDRLERMKSLLEERAKKVLRAKKALEERARELETMSEQKSGDAAARDREAMQQRAQESNRLMAERAAIAQERTTLAALIERAQARASRSHAAAIMFLFFATALVIAAGSWVVAGHFAPATYLAQSSIAMEQGGKSGDPAAVRAWTEYHQTLATDPQVVERTADRLRRFGFTDLSTAGEVGAHLADNLEVTADGKGTVTLALRGVGGSKTERVLDTLTSSVVAMANETRDRRLDRTGTVVASNAEADEQAVADPRLELFGIIAGGALLFAFMVWLVAWRTLARRKPMIETDAAVTAGDWTTA